ncbi:hypothetical protein F5Y15DRAFT_384700 [Xylariaceae sp. FL0016]|nr:hypothetical protein F5Y15DRAFT_384700 [Xylariaceae sp. FL0016]
MAPKTNFKTYEASTRLLAAVLATNKGIKLDFAELAAHMGGGATKDAVNHRLRPIKQLAKMQATALANNEDPGNLPCEKGEIQKLYGESTPAGIEWQFRDIKNLGKAQQAAVARGENPADVPTPGTPSARASRTTTATPGSRASKVSKVAPTPGSARTPSNRASASGKRKQPTYKESSTEEDGPVDSDYENLDLEDDTPSRRAEKRPKPAPANDTTPRASLFGNGAQATMPQSLQRPAAVQQPIGGANNPFSEDDGLEVIDLSQPSTAAPTPSKPKSQPVVKQEKAAKAPPAPISTPIDNDPFVGAPSLYGYDDLQDGEI